jgi:hypothetical protein
MISIKNSSSYRRDCEIYEKYIRFLHGKEQDQFKLLYKQFKEMVNEFDKQALSLDSHKMTYDTHAGLKRKLNLHKKKMDDQVKTAKHILRQIQSHRLS